jgi:hypothetical protein
MKGIVGVLEELIVAIYSFFLKIYILVHCFVATLIYEMTETSNESFVHKLTDLC